ncbi:MAG TPA: hypothetical protein VK736_06215 [Candidatus Binatia bacterium]|nr:hypothetical protein [Candidatus Binatia bacterium]
MREAAIEQVVLHQGEQKRDVTRVNLDARAGRGGREHQPADRGTQVGAGL